MKILGPKLAVWGGVAMLLFTAEGIEEAIETTDCLVPYGIC